LSQAIVEVVTLQQVRESVQLRNILQHDMKEDTEKTIVHRVTRIHIHGHRRITSEANGNPNWTLLCPLQQKTLTLWITLFELNEMQSFLYCVRRLEVRQLRPVSSGKMKAINHLNELRREKAINQFRRGGCGRRQSQCARPLTPLKSCCFSSGEHTPRLVHWESYADVDVHELMLNDQPRTLGYREAICANPSAFHGKVVLDVGCGTGILSLFSAQAGPLKCMRLTIPRLPLLRERQ
jgi:hypothetical protein